MDKPYFEVGEEVVLVSKYNPECNGDYIVCGIANHAQVEATLPDFGFIGVQIRHFYDLGFSREITSKKGYAMDSPYFGQPALRKKHKPSDESFSELMNNYYKEMEQ